MNMMPNGIPSNGMGALGMGGNNGFTGSPGQSVQPDWMQALGQAQLENFSLPPLLAGDFGAGLEESFALYDRMQTMDGPPWPDDLPPPPVYTQLQPQGAAQQPLGGDISNLQRDPQLDEAGNNNILPGPRLNESVIFSQMIGLTEAPSVDELESQLTVPSSLSQPNQMTGQLPPLVEVPNQIPTQQLIGEKRRLPSHE